VVSLPVCWLKLRDTIQGEMVLPDMQGIAAKGSLGAPFVTLHNCTCIHITCDCVVNSVFHGVFLTQNMVFLSLFEGSLP
jgi:hypothetical protein